MNIRHMDVLSNTDENSVYARDHGCFGDDRHDDTKALQSILNLSSKATPKTIVLDRGVFLCSTLYLRDGLTLVIKPEAVLKALPDIRHYPDDTHFNRYRNETHMDRCFIFAKDCENIIVCGGGEINGSADRFGRTGDDFAPRPMMLRFLNCRGVRLENIRLCESAAWTTAFLDSSGITLRDVTVRSVTNLNGDGFDFDGCHGISIENCRLNCSDDAICFQAGRYPTFDALVTGCYISSLCCGVRVGMKSMSDIYNIKINDCVFDEVWREGLKIEATEGGSIHDISITNCIMKNVRRPFWYILNNDRVSLENDRIRPFGEVYSISAKNIKITCNEKMAQTQSYFYCGKVCPMGFIGFDSSRIDAPDKKKIENITFENIDYTAYGGFSGEVPQDYPRVLDFSAGETGRSSGSYWPDYSRTVFFDIRNVKNLVMKNIVYKKLKPDSRKDNIIE